MSYGYMMIHPWQPKNEIQKARQQLNTTNICFIVEDSRSTQPHFQQLIQQLSSGDTLFVPSISYLGRDFKQIKANIIRLTKKRIQLRFLDAPFLDFSSYDETMQHQLQVLFLQMIDYISEYDNKKIKQKQQLGIKIAPKKGNYKGRQKWYTDSSKNEEKRKIYQMIIHMLAENYSITQIHRETGVSRTTIYRIRDDRHLNS